MIDELAHAGPEHLAPAFVASRQACSHFHETAAAKS
jgi:hypothetical protein